MKRHLALSALLLFSANLPSRAGEWGADGNIETSPDFYSVLVSSIPSEGCRRLLTHAGGKNEQRYKAFAEGPKAHLLFNAPVLLGAFQSLVENAEDSLNSKIRPAFHCVSAADAFRVLINHPRQFALFLSPGNPSRGIVAQIPTYQWPKTASQTAAKGQPRCLIASSDACVDWQCSDHCRKLSQFTSWQLIDNEADLQLLTQLALMSETYVYRLEGLSEIALQKPSEEPTRSVHWVLRSNGQSVHLGLFVERLSLGSPDYFPKGFPTDYFGLRLQNGLTENQRVLVPLSESDAEERARTSLGLKP